jgi:hypothetical protein
MGGLAGETGDLRALLIHVTPCGNVAPHVPELRVLRGRLELRVVVWTLLYGVPSMFIVPIVMGLLWLKENLYVDLRRTRRYELTIYKDRKPIGTREIRARGNRLDAMTAAFEEAIRTAPAEREMFVLGEKR